MARAFDPDAADPQCCAADNSDGALFEEQRQLAMAGVPEPLRRAHAAQRLPEKGNAGVKGVLKDHREWRDNENETQRLEQELRNYLLMRVARGAERSVEDSQATATTTTTGTTTSSGSCRPPRASPSSARSGR